MAGRTFRSNTALTVLTVLLIAGSLLTAELAVADGTDQPPSFLRLPPDRTLDTDPGWRLDTKLQRCVDRVVAAPDLARLVQRGDLGLALVSLNGAVPRLAEINGADMMYAASVPKIAVLYAAFQAEREGRIRIDRRLNETLIDMIRVSSNTAASRAIDRVGFNYINALLWQSGLYDPELGGGLWVGKAYGGQNDRWHRDPVRNLSHGASPLALARLLTLIGEDKLIDADASHAMKGILGDPGIHHKFVRGLDARPGSRIHRKSGTWREWHGDAALIERGNVRYVATALCHDPNGSKVLERLIVELDDCVVANRAPTAVASGAPRTALLSAPAARKSNPRRGEDEGRQASHPYSSGLE